MDLSQSTKSGECAVLIANFPTYGAEPIGVVVRDIADDRLEVKLRENWWLRFGDAEALDIWSCLAADMRQQSEQMGAKNYLDWFEATPSHLLQIGVRRNIYFRDSGAALETLYKIEVERTSAISSTSSSITNRCFPKLQTMLLSSQKAVSRVVSFIICNFRSQYRPQYVLMVALLAGIVFAKVTTHRSVVIPAHFDTVTVTAFEFPPLDHRTFFTLNLHSPGPLGNDVSAQYHSRRRRSRRKVFVPPQLTFRSPRSQLPILEPPPLSYSNVASIRATPPVSVLPGLSIPPRYRSRNKLINILSKLATPFKGESHERTSADLSQPKPPSGSAAYINRVRAR